MPANHKVSVGWQIVFTFITFLDLWAFYRIRKLRKYLLYVSVPSIALSIIVFTYVYSIDVSSPYDFVAPDPLALAVSIIIGLGFQGLAVYLVIIWSREHNRAFDAPPS